MNTNLNNPVPPVCEIHGDEGGDDREERFTLDAFEQTALPPKLMVLTKRVDRQLCENVEVVVRRNSCFLCWDVRHREMVTEIEYITGKVGPREATRAWLDPSHADEGTERERRREHRRLYELLPSQHHKLPLTGKEAFALVAACNCYPQGASLCEPSVFADQIEALLD
jgi:hypothetical protein